MQILSPGIPQKILLRSHLHANQCNPHLANQISVQDWMDEDMSNRRPKRHRCLVPCLLPHRAYPRQNLVSLFDQIVVALPSLQSTAQAM